MTSHPRRQKRPTNDKLHPLVYKSIVGLAVWLVLSIWVLFDRGAYIGLTLAVVTLFFLVLVTITLLLWLTWRNAAAADDTRSPMPTFRAWASQEFTIWQGHLSGKEAAIEILLPIVAVAFGMTLFGLVLDAVLPTIGS